MTFLKVMGVSDWNWSKSVTHTKIMVVYWLRFLLDLEKNPAQTGTSLRKYCGGTIFT